ncbi:hypothetical protein HF086_000371 [Spodoptera exigua]|uniref:YqaJ viral recombinase domain-containing protein n=1 Tax=Spodoptera exigua TaxID=7107 RepID=A0A922MAB8_SPOEX|nr:hypothetical protein HF086_000371 [Spodoptera exigua]
MKHGKKNEHTDIAALQKKLNVVIEECGLFIDDEFPFLGATPDGKYEHRIIEFKCPASCYNLEPDDAIRQKKMTFGNAPQRVL